MDHDPLAALKPLMAPEPVGWWPPAPGWWLLAAFFLLGLAAVAAWWWRRRCFLRRTRYRREALALLAAVHPAAASHEQLRDIAGILRRAAVSAWGREQIAPLSWPELNTRLPATSRLDDNSLRLLAECQYHREEPPAGELAHLRAQATQWLQQLPAREQ